MAPVGGLGRRGVPRLKLFSFRLGGSLLQRTASCSSDAYTAPEVYFPQTHLTSASLVIDVQQPLPSW